jgi:hypothetical protein
VPAEASAIPDTATTIAAVTRINAAVEADGRVVGAWSLDCWSGVIHATDPQVHRAFEDGDVAHLVGVLDGGVTLRMALAR